MNRDTYKKDCVVKDFKWFFKIFVVFLVAVILSLGHQISFAGEYENMVLIAEGPFVMGSDMGKLEEKPGHTVDLKAFFIDRYEVTNADFSKFLNDKGNNLEEGAYWISIGRGGCKIEKIGRQFRPIAGYENHPVVMVTYFGAQAYARWIKKRLPTEAEWEKAARGGLVGKKYPWGDEIDTIYANYERRKMGTTPVGIYPPNRFGLYDMAGNVGEIVSDFYSSNYYKISPKTNPKGPETGEYRVVRGGNYLSHSEGLSVLKREKGPDSYISLPNVGFRLVKDVK